MTTATTAQRARPTVHGAVRILIVDDEPSYRDYLARYLELHRYDVRSASSVGEALAIAEEFEPDVVVADWLLRGATHGLGVAQRLRERNESLRIVLMTGLPTAEIREEAARAGVRRLLEKPFGLDDLARAVAEANSHA